MLEKTKAIVLQKTNYSESSLVVQLFTQNHGRVGVLVPGVRKKKARTKSALFEPLSILEIVGDFSDTNKLIRPREVKISTPLPQFQQSIFKGTIVLFLSEILNKVLRISQPDPHLFEYIEHALIILEGEQESTHNYHMVFLLKLTQFLGFHPQITPGDYFDLMEGTCSTNIPSGKYYLAPAEKEVFIHCLGTKIDKQHELKISNQERRELLENILQYYSLHIPEMGTIKSHNVLQSIFN